MRPVAVVVSRYNGTVTRALESGAVSTLRAAGATAAVVDAPGAFELPAIAGRCVESGAYRGVICLGCVIRGETSHDRHISSAVAHAIAVLAVDSGVPVTFGVITAETADQARARAGGSKGNKGEEAATALLETLAAFDAIDRAVASGRPTEIERKAAVSSPDKAG